MARVCLTPYANRSQWLDLFWELDIEDFISETSVAASNGAGSSHSLVATLTFPLFETSLPDATDLRLVPFKDAFVLESGLLKTTLLLKVLRFWLCLEQV